MRLIPEWRRAHRLWSVRLSLAGAAAGVVLDYLPQVQDCLPRHWYIGLFLACLVARLVSQEKTNER